MPAPSQTRFSSFLPGDRIVATSERGASLFPKRYIWWNFVFSSRDRIEQAKEKWKSRRFDIVQGDDEEYIPLPG